MVIRSTELMWGADQTNKPILHKITRRTNQTTVRTTTYSIWLSQTMTWCRPTGKRSATILILWINGLKSQQHSSRGTMRSQSFQRAQFFRLEPLKARMKEMIVSLETGSANWMTSISQSYHKTPTIQVLPIWEAFTKPFNQASIRTRIKTTSREFQWQVCTTPSNRTIIPTIADHHAPNTTEQLIIINWN